jgi:hypothetical protein
LFVKTFPLTIPFAIMENANPPSPTLEFYQKKYNYTSLDITRWRNEMRRTGSYIDFIEYLEKREKFWRNPKDDFGATFTGFSRVPNP